MHPYIIFKIYIYIYIYYKKKTTTKRVGTSWKPIRKSFKKGNTKNVNKYQTLFNNVRTRVL
jgi:hypothetical protein